MTPKSKAPFLNQVRNLKEIHRYAGIEKPFRSFVRVPLRDLNSWLLSCQVLHEFDTNGPIAGLVLGDDGLFYGTTPASVFRLALTGKLTTLYSSAGKDSFDFSSSLIQGTNGHFYGVTQFDNGGNGTMFELLRTGELKILAAFGGTNGAGPYGRLLLATDGNLYGTTQWGGANGQGTIFRVTPDGALTTLYSFGSLDGAQALGGLIEKDGAVYGATTLNDNIFKTTTGGEFTRLVHLDGPNGFGFVNLTLARNGNLYGTTAQGGASAQGGAAGGGTFFKMTPEGQLVTLASFFPDTGTFPNGLVERMDGNFYGTARDGGPSRNGTAFKVTPAGEITTLAVFNGSNGREPRGELLEGRDGILYGVARLGGKNNAGTFFRVIPAPHLSITQVRNAISLSWNSMTGAVYRLESKRSLTESTWTPVANAIPSNGSTTSYTLNQSGPSEGYYRLVLE